MEIESNSIDIDEFTLAMEPLFNHLILKIHRVSLKRGGIEMPTTENADSGFFEVIAVGRGVAEGEPCPVEVGAWVMPMPGAAKQMTPDYFTCPWVALLSEIDKCKIEKQVQRATGSLVLVGSKPLVTN